MTRFWVDASQKLKHPLGRVKPGQGVSGVERKPHLTTEFAEPDSRALAGMTMQLAARAL
jgi:hypothetical protein